MFGVINLRATQCPVRAKKDFDECTATCYDFDDFCNCLDRKKLVLAPFCGEISCEDNIKKLSARSVGWSGF